MTSRRVLADTGKVIGAGIIGATAAAACVVCVFLLPAILGVLIEGVLSTFGIVRTALAIIVVSFTSWFLQMSPGSMLLVWVVAATVSGVIGGFIGSFLGCICGMLVLKRVHVSDNETLG
jgi:hypothetical protein